MAGSNWLTFFEGTPEYPRSNKDFTKIELIDFFNSFFFLVFLEFHSNPGIVF